MGETEALKQNSYKANLYIIYTTQLKAIRFDPARTPKGKNKILRTTTYARGMLHKIKIMKHLISACSVR